MQQEYSSETLLKPATLYFAFDGKETAAVGHRYSTARRDVSRVALHLAYINSDNTAVTPKTEPDRKTVWSKVLDFILEGFSISGVSLCPVDDFLDDERWSETKHRPQEKISPNGQRVIGMLPAPSPMVAPRWNWLASSRDVATAISEHLRKERDIKRAVDALSELDDKTLHDIGIPHRSRIEYVVRYCHDC
ncbi:DUF1127 domain-containing protein [Bradyrhizobium sp. SYSU BS000235]|uniref:DUF1127 domain-containing protein n=1 Tax=Bradyrhizobium sp. SYSU BS000235 TaxID=3411332 RepID=UPI003C75FFA9